MSVSLSTCNLLQFSVIATVEGPYTKSNLCKDYQRYNYSYISGPNVEPCGAPAPVPMVRFKPGKYVNQTSKSFGI